MDTRGFYDGLADRYEFVYADWNASVARQGRALDALLTAALAPDRTRSSTTPAASEPRHWACPRWATRSRAPI
ncbi:hypothetical protein [Streptomyces yangpuensis]